jgi:hypothetical protein
MCLRLDRPTARKIWVYLGDLFTGNKSSRVVHLECELHNLVQGEMSANDYCHRLQQLANSLADCDVPVGERALVHQLIRGLNPKFSVLKTLLPLLPKFPSFVEARELVLSDEASWDADSKRASETALLAANGSTPKPDAAPPAPPASDRAPNNTFYNGGRGRGRGRGGGRGVEAGTVVTVTAAATTTTVTSTMLLAGGNHGAAPGARPGPVPRVLVFLAPVCLPCRVRPFKPTNRPPCKHLCKLHLGIPPDSCKLFRPPPSSNPTTKVTGTWISVHRLI